MNESRKTKKLNKSARRCVKCSSYASCRTGRLVSGGWDKTARLWGPPLDGSHPALVLRGHTVAVNAVAVLPEAGLVVTASGDTTLRLWRGAPLWELFAVCQGVAIGCGLPGCGLAPGSEVTWAPGSEVTWVPVAREVKCIHRRERLGATQKSVHLWETTNGVRAFSSGSWTQQCGGCFPCRVNQGQFLGRPLLPCPHPPRLLVNNTTCQGHPPALAQRRTAWRSSRALGPRCGRWSPWSGRASGSPLRGLLPCVSYSHFQHTVHTMSFERWHIFVATCRDMRT